MVFREKLRKKLRRIRAEVSTRQDERTGHGGNKISKGGKSSERHSSGYNAAWGGDAWSDGGGRSRKSEKGHR